MYAWTLIELIRSVTMCFARLHYMRKKTDMKKKSNHMDNESVTYVYEIADCSRQ